MKINTLVPGSRTTAIHLLAFLLMGLCLNTYADEHESVDPGISKLSRLFQSHDQLNIRLQAPFKKLSRKRGKDRPYFAAVLNYKDDAGKDVQLDLKVRVRGKYRAKKEICRFPPLKLNFSKATLAGTIFDGEDKLKLVTHCKSASKYEQFVLLEYLSYRIQNILTDYSLRPRLVTVEYLDSNSGKVIDTRVGFFIEDEGRMANRVGAEALKVKRVDRSLYRQDLLHMATIFEYMLGNTDFSVVLGPAEKDCCHNIIPLKTSDGSIVPVPYDFDATGIVNAPYVSPTEKLGIRSNRERLYRGYCQNTEGFKNSFAVFIEKRDAIFDLYSKQTGLTERTFKNTKGYLEDFYEAITNDDKIVSEFIEKCRK